MECIDHISSIILEKTKESRLTGSASCELKLIEVETVHTNNSSTIKTGAPALELKRYRLPSEPIIQSTVTKSKLPRIELPKFSGDITKF